METGNYEWIVLKAEFEQQFGKREQNRIDTIFLQ